MKHFSAVLILSLAVSCGNQAEDKSADIKHPYLGQTPPGMTPEPFAPGLVSSEHYEYNGVFTPDMKEFYVIKNGGDYEKSTFVVFKYEDGEWVESIESRRLGQATFSADGNIMYLGARYKERTPTGWSERKDLDAPLNDSDDKFVMRLTAAENGTLYFDTYFKDHPEFPIRYSRLIDGQYEQPRELSSAINSGNNRNHPFIAPDESYLIWDAERAGGYGDSDIYISFRSEDGSWGNAINLGDQINTGAWEAAATVTPDGKYIFFNRNLGSDDYENVEVFWVDAQVIENLRPE